MLLKKGFVFLLKFAIKKVIFADDLLATESVLAFSSCVRTKPYFNLLCCFEWFQNFFV